MPDIQKLLNTALFFSFYSISFSTKLWMWMCGMSFFTSLTANFYKKEGRGKGGRAGIGRYSIVYSRKTVKIFFFFFYWTEKNVWKNSGEGKRVPSDNKIHY